ncbi:hypothetical protein GG496_000564 [Candidatus Fervidibacteria bacterium JGI MDM2 JNZ-1-D12]
MVIKDKGQFLAKAKALIAQNIQGRTFFTRGDLIRFISLDPNVEESVDHLVTLQTLTERRYIDWFEEPDRGRFHPKAPANLNSVWDIASTPPSSFVSDTQIYPIAGSQQVFPCSICSGTGELTVACRPCEGSGRRICYRCSGTGSEVCSSCNGSGTRVGFNDRLERCSSCDGSGRRICYSCNGRGGEVCDFCRGTGRVIERCSRCDGVGRLIRYQAVVCEFKPHEFTEVVSRWGLPLKEMKAAEASSTWQTNIQPSLPLSFSQFPQEVQGAINLVANQAKGLEVGDTRLIRTQLSVKAVPVAHVSFRLHGVPGDAWFLGKDFQRVFIPKVPFTFETWLRLKDWISVGLAILSLLGFVGFALTAPTIYLYGSDNMFWLLLFCCAIWVISGVILLVRRLIAGLILFAVTISILAALIYWVWAK